MFEAKRLSCALVRLHPRAWRERYGEEMMALIEASEPTWTQTFDLFKGCVDGWLQTPLPRALVAGPMSTLRVIDVLRALGGAVFVHLAADAARGLTGGLLETPQFVLWRDFLLRSQAAILNAILLLVIAFVIPRIEGYGGLSYRQVRLFAAMILLSATASDFGARDLLLGPIGDALPRLFYLANHLSAGMAFAFLCWIQALSAEAIQARAARTANAPRPKKILFLE